MERFGLSSDERIKKTKDFRKIYLNGKVVFSYDKRIKAVYLFHTDQNNSVVNVAAAVSKKAGKAVWRNRVKRLIKESFRLNKLELVSACREKKISLCIIFTPVGFSRKENKKIKLVEIMPVVVELMKKIQACL